MRTRRVNWEREERGEPEKSLRTNNIAATQNKVRDVLDQCTFPERCPSYNILNSCSNAIYYILNSFCN